MLVPAAALALAATALAGPARADRVLLAGDHLLTGRVTAVDDGRVTLLGELSAEPLVVQPAALRSVTFAPAAPPGQTAPDQQVQLHNGDVIPCRIESMDDRTIRAATWFAGLLEIPRRHVAALQLGVSEPAVVLAPRDALHGWSESEAWTVDEAEQAINSSDTGRIMRRLDPGLPARFILRFRYEWKGNPGLRFYFADDLPAEGAADRYFLTINTAGMELKRQSTQGRTNHSLASDPRRPNEVSPQGMDIELRVDRKQREPLIHLLVNGDLVGRFVDPVGRAPAGSGLMIESSSGNNSQNIIRQLQVLEWSGEAVTRPRRNDDEDPFLDTVCDRQGERFSGTAERIADENGRRVIVFRHPHAADPLRVPLDQAACLWLRVPADATPAAAPPLTLALTGNGSLQLDSCRIDEQSATCAHPLLGALTIDRRAVAALETRRPPNPPGP